MAGQRRRWTDRIDPADLVSGGGPGGGRLAHVLLLSIFAVFVCFVVWARSATLDEVTRGDGKIIPSSQMQVVQHLEGGILAELMVEEGEIVDEGQVLMRITNKSADAELGEQRKRYSGLLAAAARLVAEAHGAEEILFPDKVLENAPEVAEREERLFAKRRNQLEQQSAILRAQVSQKRQELRELQAKVKQLGRSRSLAQQELDLLKPLVEVGAAPRLDLLRTEQKRQDLDTQIAGVELAIPRTEAAVNEAERRLAEKLSTFQAEAQEELNDLRVEIARLEEEITAGVDRSARTEVRSPVHGTINKLTINTIGGVIRPGDDLVEIVPLQDTLLVEARIRPADRAQLWPGLPAVVKVTAYDYSIYGGLDATLVDISPDTITDEKGESFYRIRLRTDDSSLGEDKPIIPGMTTSVDILTGQKTVLDYILKPIIKAQQNALRER